MVNITIKDVNKFSFETNQPFTGGTLSANFGIDNYSYLHDKTNDTTSYFFLESNYNIPPEMSAFTMEIKVEVSFALIPRNEVTAQDIYTCIQKTSDKIQEVVNAIYSFKDGVIPSIETLPFDVLEDTINNLLREAE